MKTRGQGDQKFLEDLLDTHAGLEVSSVKTLCASEDRLFVVKKLESMLIDMRKDVDLSSSLVQVIAGRMRRRLKSSAGTEAIKEA